MGNLKMEIPTQLKKRGIRFVLVEKSGKKPFQVGWQKKIIEFDNQELLEHIANGGNYGVMGGSFDDNGTSLILVDFDNLDIQEKAMKFLPETFTVKTGSGMYHLYYFTDGIGSFKGLDDEKNNLFDVQSEGKQVVGPGSIHPNGNSYEVFKDIEIQTIGYAELKAILVPFDRSPTKKEEKKIEKYTSEHDDTFLDDLKNRVTIPDVLNWIGIDTSNGKNTQCPFHDSKGGKCLGFHQETCHCFHCDGSWNIFSLVKEYKNCDFKDALEILTDLGGMRKEYEESKKRYIEKKRAESKNEKRDLKYQYLSLIKEKHWGEASELLVDYIKRKNYIYTTKDDIKTEMWIYKDGIYVPQGKSEIKEMLREILDNAYSTFTYNIIISKLEPDTYIDQDKFFNIIYKDEVPVENGILNIITNELKSFDPKKIFFSKLPIRFDQTKKCPAIEQFIKDIVSSKSDVCVLEELAGFSLLKEYRFEISIMLNGLGRNGKTKFIELLKRLVGIENCCSVPLHSLNSESFSISELFGKMLNIVGDISNEDLKDTSTFKHLTGRDLISGKRKFLRDIVFVNYAKFVFACNELPMVYDMSRGFWDRWILLEFPYTFVTQEEYDLAEDKTKLKIRDEDIINKITTPDEMSGFLNLALKGLQRLLKNHKFSTSNNCEDVKSKWIRKSNSFTAFCYENIEEGEGEEIIVKKELRKKYSNYCKEHKILSKSDMVIRRVLQEMFGTSEENKPSPFGGSWEYVWTGIKWKTLKEHQRYENNTKNHSSPINPLNSLEETPKVRLIRDFEDLGVFYTLRRASMLSYDIKKGLSPQNLELFNKIKTNLDKQGGKKFALSHKNNFESCENINLSIRKNDKIESINLKEGEIYQIKDFGDDFEQIITILLESSKVRLILDEKEIEGFSSFLKIEEKEKESPPSSPVLTQEEIDESILLPNDDSSKRIFERGED